MKATRSVKGRATRSKEARYKFAGTCYICGKKGHKQQDCWKKYEKKQNGEQAFTVIEHDAEGWLLDGSASSHMCPFENEFVDISIANEETFRADGVGTIRVVLKNQKPIRIENVLYVPGLDRRLLSTSALSSKGLHITFLKNKCEIRNQDEVVTQVTQKGILFILEFEQVESAKISQEAGVIKSVSPRIWHARLGYLPMKAFRTLENCVEGLKMTDMSVAFDH